MSSAGHADMNGFNSAISPFCRMGSGACAGADIQRLPVCAAKHAGEGAAVAG